jgi:2,5-diketo-D-gluconate reductase B
MQHLDVKGAHVPALGLGTWQMSGRTCYDGVRQAIELGYRHIDTAQIYGNEAEVGRAIRDSGIARGDLFVTTKVAPGNLAGAKVRRSTEESLRRLGLDQLDLLLIHWPTGEAPLGETLDALAALRQAGKTRFIGVSNFTVALLKEAVEAIGADLLCNQVEYHPFLSQRLVMAAVRHYGMMLTAYTPLARRGAERDRTLTAIGRKYGKSPAQVALRWLLGPGRRRRHPQGGEPRPCRGQYRHLRFRAQRRGPRRDRRLARQPSRRRSWLGAALGPALSGTISRSRLRAFPPGSAARADRSP